MQVYSTCEKNVNPHLFFYSEVSSVIIKNDLIHNLVDLRETDVIICMLFIKENQW